ncbi:MAG: hypothetical protein PHH70_04320 [Candidatus Gracilibacteria bacterium]|nr:hypothetical protein [Candidatus Gracilibacteria bacterium]
MDKLTLLEQEIAILKERNAKVDGNKAWETSLARKTSIAILTYFVVVLFFFVVQTPNPLINALVPVIGFILSTLSISLIKKLWIQHIYKK